MTPASSAGTLDEADRPLAPEAAVTPDLADHEEVRLLAVASDVATVDDRARVRFLAQPSWGAGSGAVASVVSPYVRAFWPDEDVSLVLVLPADDARSLADAERMARDAIEACGRSADEVPEIVIARVPAKRRSSLLERVDAVAATDRTLVEAASDRGVRVVALSRGALRAAFGDAVARREFERLVPMLRSLCAHAAAEHPWGAAVSPLVDTFVDGYRQFLVTGEAREGAVAALRALGWLTDGRVGEPLSALWARAHPPYDITLGAALLSEHEVARVVVEVAETGVALIPGRFPGAARAQLAAWARGGRDLSEPVLLGNRVVRAFAMDLSALAVAQGVLGCAPVITGIEMRGGIEPAAERSGRDDRRYRPADTTDALHVVVFLGACDGEVRLVRGSHRSWPPALRRAGEFTEEEIASAYGVESLVPVVGPPGTIVIADARCLRSIDRRGAGAPLSLATHFASSLFAAPPRPVPFDHDAPGGFAQVVERCPRTFRRFVDSGAETCRPVRADAPGRHGETVALVDAPTAS